MITVGILANNPVWEEYLSAFSQGAPFRINGRADDHLPDQLADLSWYNSSDAIWIPEFTPNSIEAAIFALRQSRHVLLGFPVISFQDQIDQIVSLSREANVEVQVGHHDRYHPAFRAVKDQLNEPRFIRITHQLEAFDQEDENLLLQQLLYDVDAVLGITDAPIKRVSAHISKITPVKGRVIDVRLEFHNGAAASIALSSLGFPAQRVIEISDYQSFYTIDLNRGQAHAYYFCDEQRTEARLWPVNGVLGVGTGQVDEESLTRECVSFFHRKESNRKPLASVEEGYQALLITREIFRKIGIGLS